MTAAEVFTPSEVNQMLAAHGVDTSSIVAKTFGYRPFVMGGSTEYIMACKVPCLPPIDAGKGFYVCLVQRPNGRTIVCEATTGAIVGDTLEQVKSDIADCDDIEVMHGQIEDFRSKCERMDQKLIEDPAEFWAKFRD